MTTYKKDFYATASITDKSDGSARLVIRLNNGKKVHDKIHKSRKAAESAWYRYSA